MSGSVLETESFLDRAEMEYLFGAAKSEFIFPIRRKGEVADYYARLETELRTQDLLAVQSYRVVKESFAKVSRPAALVLTEAGLLRRRPHLAMVKAEIARLGSSIRSIDAREFLRQNSRDALADIALTRDCFEVFEYLLAHRDEVMGLLPRQIPHGRSTKLLGRENLLLKMFSFWRGEPGRWRDFHDFFGLLDRPAEFRFFAPVCSCQERRLSSFHGLLARDWQNDLDFDSLKGTLIIENLESFYAAIADSRATLLIWGGGWKAVQLHSLWTRLPKPVYYWGDIDKEGYEIFGYLNARHPELSPLMMSREWIDKYRTIQQKKEIFLGPFRQVSGLQAEYEWVSRNGIQIEQEQMREPWPFGAALE
jgi:hypothetical protein